MLSSSQVNEFNRNGFLNGGRVITDDVVDELCAELDRIITIQQAGGFKDGDPRPVMISKWGKTPESIIWQVVNIWEASPAYERLLYLPAVVKAISQLANHPDIQVWHDQIQYKPPHHGGINNWHQDWPYWPIIKPPIQVTAWIALDDVDESNGCMWMVPGSHKWGNNIKLIAATPEEKFFEVARDYTPPADAEVRKVEPRPWPVKKGEVSFHHSMTWHGSHQNTSDRPRRAIAIHFMTGDARYVASGQHPMKPYVQVDDGGSMMQAGEHFPIVCRNGNPVPMPQKVAVS
jgi:ectoine hydroxylase-related dioxygenase (phytanoyl-CoA dioxygenase family)